MKVFKFGGGVLKTAEDARQLIKVLKKYKQERLIIVVSAFNKITNKLEGLLNSQYSEKSFNSNLFQDIYTYHISIVNELFENSTKEKTTIKIDDLFKKLEHILKNKLSGNYHFDYDNVVSFGELLSSTIISDYLEVNKFNSTYKDIRKIIITDSIYTEAGVDWDKSVKNILNNCISDSFQICVTQGFIASDENGNTTTLGREGSDFTASILAFAVNAEEVVFWKEVDGIYNADPTITSDFQLLPKLSYRESVEQAFYGAKILHPKTIKPLQNKQIPIRVKSFYKPDEQGTNIIDIAELSPELYPNIPIYIIKEDQILISVSTLDFSFISEDNLGRIFTLLSDSRIKVNLMQSSAISFSFCITNNKYKIPDLIEALKKSFSVLYNDHVSLVTIRHYTPEAINKMISGKEVLLTQNSRHTSRYIVK